MAELTTRERRQPCLLDRLTDDEPQSKVESRDKRVLSAPQMRAAVLRDLEWLFNTSTRVDQSEWADTPLVASSVLNYGVPDMCGMTASGVLPGVVEKMVLEAIKRFEPRILTRGLSVRAVATGSMGPNAVGFEIVGELWGQPLPEALYVKTELDLETGRSVVRDNRNG